MKAFFSLLALLAAFSAPAAAQTEHVVLAGGCFWGMQGVFEHVKGVTHVVAGYSGGAASTAHYEMVSTGMTGHAESVDVTFDPSVISFKKLLDVYFLVAHDPTELNFQGPDHGSQYRSEIYYTSNAQRSEAMTYIAQLDRRHVYSAPAVTKLESLRAFYPAEDYHQDFMKKNPDNEYIVYNDVPKIERLHEAFPALYKA